MPLNIFQINNLDLIISTRDNQEVEFKLVDGSGPVYITCMHVLEIPAAEDNLTTLMTTAELEEEDEEEEEEEEEEADVEEEEDITDEKAIKEKAANKRKAIKNGTNGNGAHHEAQAEADDKPKKRKRN